MLKIKDLSAGYGELKVLKKVSIEVKPGKIVALIGPNGAGKSTVLKSIFSVTDIESGKIIFDDKDITKLPTHELIEVGISYVPQGRINFSDMTVLENLELGAFHSSKETFERSLKEVYLKFPILKEKAKEYAYTLSGGQQQLLALGRALMQSPKLLLLDEPSLGLSPKAMKEIFNIIKTLNKEGICVLMVEQNAKKAIEIAHRTYVLEDGKVALTGGKNIIKNKKIKSIYLGGR